MSNKKVSVVIPFYNQVNWLIEAIESVLCQTFTDFEIIVINDGSQEDISSFLHDYKDRITYKWKENGGPGSARNLGIEMAKGEYIAFLDSDDVWEPPKLELQVKRMDETKAIWSHTYWAQFADNQTDSIARIYGPESKNNTFPGSLASINIATPCVMIRAKYLKNRFDLRFHEKMRFGQDNYLWLLLSSEHDICLIPQILCKVRLRGNNTVKRARAHIQVRAMIWEYLGNDHLKLFYSSNVSPGIRVIYRICLIEHHFLSWLEKLSWINSNFIEITAKVIYIIPYIGFKLYKKIMN